MLAAEAYREHLTNAGLDGSLAVLADVPATAADAPDTIAHLDVIRGAIVQTPLSTAVVDAVRDFLEHTGLSRQPIAVRSSATAEDSAEASFAGIHESVLNAIGLDATLDAIVAREYGLPAVVNVREALTSIEDGDMLEVNGDAGEVAVGE